MVEGRVRVFLEGFDVVLVQMDTVVGRVVGSVCRMQPLWVQKTEDVE